MGLRVNTNTSAMSALRALSITDKAQARSLTRLATGLRLNSGADGPGDLLISDQLNGQIIASQQALENVQLDTSMIATADGGLQNISDLLSGIKDSITFALNTATSSPDAIQAQQDSVDQALSAITRQAQATNFNGRSLLDGSSAITTRTVTAGLDNLVVRQMDFAPVAAGTIATRTVTLASVTNPARANLTVSAGFPLASNMTLLVTGPRGSAEVALASGTTQANWDLAINNVSSQTGVISNAAGTELFSEDFGTSQQISVKVISNAGAGTITLEGTAITSPGDSMSDRGIDGVYTVDGQTVTGKGRSFDVNLPGMSFSFEHNIATNAALAETLALTAAPAFTAEKTGLSFQIGARTTPSDSMTVGIRSVTAASLGLAESAPNYSGGITGADLANTTQGGTLLTLGSGGTNSLAGNAAGASFVIDVAVRQVDALRAQLGSLQSNLLDPQQRQLQVQIENLSAARSIIRDLNFAEETTTFTKNQILFQSGTAALASANLIPQSVLTLLR